MNPLGLVVHHLRTFGLAPTAAKVLRRLGLATGYGRWRRRLEPQTSRPGAPEGPPRFSIVVPLYRTTAAQVRALAATCRAQTLGAWELVLVVDPAMTSAALRVVKAAVEADPGRVRAVAADQNRGIAAQTNLGLAQARGEWVVFLDHDDTLAPWALEAVAGGLAAHPGAVGFYSDEDKLTSGWGRRVLPFLKADWSPETLWGYNYACHLLVVKRSAGQAVGWLRPEFDGAQDYDFILRVTDHGGPLVHLPQVLYHWRMAPGSTAHRPEAKLYAYEAARRALAEHLERRGLAGRVDHGPSWGTYRVRLDPAAWPRVSVIVPHRNHPQMLETFLSTLLGLTDYPDFEVLVAENGSNDPGTFEAYRRWAADPRVRVVPWDEGRDFNYSSINNDTVARHATGQVLAFLNNDVEVTHADWLKVMVEKALVPAIAAVGAKLVYPDGSLQHGGIVVGIAGFAGHPFKGSPPGASGYYSVLQIERNVSAVTGACLVVRRSVFDQVGGFDPDFALGGNDVDLCLRFLAAGYRNLWTPYATLVHHESKTRGYETTPAQRARHQAEKDLFAQKHGAFLAAGDPYYHRGLTLDSEDWSLRR